MLSFSPYYFSVKEAAQLSGRSLDYIESLIEQDKVRTKRRLIIMDKKERGMNTFVHITDLFNHAFPGAEMKEKREKIVADKRKKLIRGFTFTFFVFLLFITSVALTNPIELISSALAPEEKVSLYAENCYGDWDFTSKSEGEPDVLDDAGLEFFSKNNSAIYEGGAKDIICNQFSKNQEIEEIKEKDIIEAEVKFSFALGEKDPDIIPSDEDEDEEDADEDEDEEEEEDDESDEDESDEDESDEDDEDESDEDETDEEDEDDDEDDANEEDDESDEEEDDDEDDADEDKDDDEDDEDDADKDDESDEDETDEDEEDDDETEEDEEEDEETDEDKEDESDETEETTLRDNILAASQSIKDKIWKPAEVFAEEIDEEEGQSGFSSDTKVIIYYTFEDEDPEWHDLYILSGEEISNKLNGGYFSKKIDSLEDWDDLNNLQIKAEGVAGGDTTFTAYMDSIWVDVTYGEKQEREYFLEAEKTDFRADETPSFTLNEKDKGFGIMRSQRDWDVREVSLRKANGKSKRLEKGKGFSMRANSPMVIEIDETYLSPGKHTLSLKVGDGNQEKTLEKEFTWGVLAMNFNKSVYSNSDDEKA